MCSVGYILGLGVWTSSFLFQILSLPCCASSLPFFRVSFLASSLVISDKSLLWTGDVLGDLFQPKP